MLVDFRKIDGWVSSGVLFGVLFREMVLLGAFFGGVLLEVLVCKHCYLGSLLVYPYTQYPLFSGYDVDPLLKKEVFTMENQVFPKK